MCIRTTGTPAPDTTAAIRGSPDRPHTSFTMAAPACSALSATPARYVSTLMGTVSRDASLSMTGITRDVSSASETGRAPGYTDGGRVDMPPTSSRSTPDSWKRSASRTAASTSLPTPSPEKESGVTLTTPMTYVRAPHSKGVPPMTVVPYRTPPRLQCRSPQTRPVLTSPAQRQPFPASCRYPQAANPCGV